MSQQDTTVSKVSGKFSPTGQMGQKYLASGRFVSMRLWEQEAPSDALEMSTREYETVGYVISGTAQLHFSNEQMVLLEPGDSWVVPKNTAHAYKIVKTFTAVEATSPPAQVHSRDE